MSTLRLKLLVSSVKKIVDAEGKISGEELEMNAVYGKEGSANAQWSKWTPSAQLRMTVNNPDAFDRVKPGDFLFADLTHTEKDSI